MGVTKNRNRRRVQTGRRKKINLSVRRSRRGSKRGSRRGSGRRSGRRSGGSSRAERPLTTEDLLKLNEHKLAGRSESYTYISKIITLSENYTNLKFLSQTVGVPQYIVTGLSEMSQNENENRLRNGDVIIKIGEQFTAYMDEEETRNDLKAGSVVMVHRNVNPGKDPTPIYALAGDSPGKGGVQLPPEGQQLIRSASDNPHLNASSLVN
jgi:hypothetical protein